MNIAVFVWEFPPRIVGGLGIYAAEISQQFIKLGNDTTIFTMNDGALPTRGMWRGIEVHRPLLTDIGDAFHSFVAEDIRKWGPGMKFFSDVMMYNILSASKLINDLVPHERRRIDLVVAHDWLSIIGGMASKRGLKVPLIFHVHSTERGRSMGGGSAVVGELEYRGGQVADLVITVSHSMRDELIGLGFPEEKIRVCYNGVDPQKYDPDKVDLRMVEEVRRGYGLQPGDFMILFVGRLVAIKGVDRLVMAMPYILNKFPKAKLIVVGLGDMQPYLVNLVDSLGLRDSVKFCFKFLSEEDRILHYAACDVAVFPSLYEPFGIVALEAMSMAKPVVVGVGKMSGMGEVVIPSGHQQTGFHVNPYDPVDIASGVVKALSDPEASKSYGRNGRERVVKCFTWEKVAEDTLRIYEEALKRP